MASSESLSFQEFYPRYLHDHRQRGTRILHFIGTSLFLLALVLTLVLRQPWLILAGVMAAYGFAWVGHFFVEHNRPATFQHPWLSLRGDFKLYFDLWRGRERFGPVNS
ncbi:DUF962 domain-containing protein [Hymenobacter sp. BT175]|uniref:DUF962 domain-containing protein n=1 Tax=Hymenobacter translucens TaxID=2886507 RepID=UPI001D0E85E6|nr:DUF962 domain-containing protein [Hymenobacter translucens]MCC2547256.1 DUF962 domain-containing protein [Hymenobacter translucens]